MTIAEELDALRKLLRHTARNYPAPLPADLQVWWDAEKLMIAKEKIAEDARRTERISMLTAKIAELQAELAKL